MPQARAFFHVGADNYLQLGGVDENGDPVGALRNRITGEYPTDATVTATIRTRAGAVVAGSLNLPMPYVAGTTGTTTAYRGYVQDTLPLPIGLYEATVTATKDGIVESFRVPITVEKG